LALSALVSLAKSTLGGERQVQKSLKNQGLTRQKTRKFIAAGLVGSVPVRLSEKPPKSVLFGGF